MMIKQAKPKNEAAKKFSQALTQEVRNVRELTLFPTRLETISSRNSERMQDSDRNLAIEKVKEYLDSQDNPIYQQYNFIGNDKNQHISQGLESAEISNLLSSHPSSSRSNEEPIKCEDIKDNYDKVEIVVGNEGIKRIESSSIDRNNEYNSSADERLNEENNKFMQKISSIQYLRSDENRYSLLEVDLNTNFENDLNIGKSENKNSSKKMKLPLSNSEKSIQGLLGNQKAKKNSQNESPNKENKPIITKPKVENNMSKPPKNIEYAFKENSNQSVESKNRSKSNARTQKSTESTINSCDSISSISTLKNLEVKPGLKIKTFEPVLKTLNKTNSSGSKPSLNSSMEHKKTDSSESRASQNILSNSSKCKQTLEPDDLDEEPRTIPINKVEKEELIIESTIKPDEIINKACNEGNENRDLDTSITKNDYLGRKNSNREVINVDHFREISLERIPEVSKEYYLSSKETSKAMSKQVSLEGTEIIEKSLPKQDIVQDSYDTPRDNKCTIDNSKALSKEKYEIFQTPYFDMQKLSSNTQNILSNSKNGFDVKEFSPIPNHKKIPRPIKNNTSTIQAQAKTGKTQLANEKNVEESTPIVINKQEIKKKSGLDIKKKTQPDVIKKLAVSPIQQKSAEKSKAERANVKNFNSGNKELHNRKPSLEKVTTSTSMNLNTTNIQSLSSSQNIQKPIIEEKSLIDHQNTSKTTSSTPNNNDMDCHKLSNDSEIKLNSTVVKDLEECCTKISIKSFLTLRAILKPHPYVSLACEGLAYLFAGFPEVSEDIEVKVDDTISWQNIKILFSMPIRFVNLMSNYKYSCESHRMPLQNIIKVQDIINQIEKLNTKSLHEELGITAEYSIHFVNFLKAAIAYYHSVKKDYQSLTIQSNKTHQEIIKEPLSNESDIKNQNPLFKDELLFEEPKQLKVQPNLNNQMIIASPPHHDININAMRTNDNIDNSDGGAIGNYFTESLEELEGTKAAALLQIYEKKLEEETSILNEISKKKNDLINQVEKLKKAVTSTTSPLANPIKARSPSISNKIENKKTPVKSAKKHSNSLTPNNLKSVFQNEKINQASVNKTKLSDTNKQTDPNSLNEYIYNEYFDDDIHQNLQDIRDYKKRINKMLLENDKKEKQMSKALEKSEAEYERNNELNERKKLKEYLENKRINETNFMRELGNERLDFVKSYKDMETNEEKMHFVDNNTHYSLIQNMKKELENEKKSEYKQELKENLNKINIDRNYKKYQQTLEKSMQLEETRTKKKQHLDWKRAQTLKEKERWEKNFNIISKLLTDHK